MGRVTRLSLPPILLCVLATRGFPQVAAQAPAEGETLFRQVVPHPTGRNGYEEIVLAAEAIRGSQAIDEASATDATLARKRQALGTRRCLRALDLLRRGLKKPVSSPRETIGFDTQFAEMGPFQRLGRLLIVEQYVLLADGRTGAAIGSLRDSLRFGRAIQADSFTGGMTGLGVMDGALRSLARQMDQLSAPDFERLFAVCREWLEASDPWEKVAQSEWRKAREMLTSVRAEPALLGDRVGELVKTLSPDQNRSFLRALEEAAQSNPVQFALELDRAGRWVDDTFGRIREQIEMPAWERKPFLPRTELSPGEQLAEALTPGEILERLPDSSSRERALVQLLACHAAIRRYRWEFGNLPASLEALRIGSLAQDPFTGQPLRYAAQGQEYELNSAGPLVEAGDPRAVDGRLPIALEGEAGR